VIIIIAHVVKVFLFLNTTNFKYVQWLPRYSVLLSNCLSFLLLFWSKEKFKSSYFQFKPFGVQEHALMLAFSTR
jgi:hypothetical protein